MIATIATSRRTERRRKAARPFPGQPVASEARNDPAADQRDQQNDGRDADPNADVGGAIHMGFDMEGNIAGQKQRDQHDHLKIAPVLAGKDFPRRGGRDQREEAGVNQERRQPADLGGGRHRDAAGYPDQNQRQQRPALNRQAGRSSSESP